MTDYGFNYPRGLSRTTGEVLRLVALALFFAIGFLLIMLAASREVKATEPGDKYEQSIRVTAPSHAKPAGHRPVPTATASGRPSSDLIDEAKRWIGTNPTDRNALWCARFMNFVLKRTGHQSTNSDAASSFATYGTPLFGPRPGAIAILKRNRGNHVGIVLGVDRSGNPIIISGNHNKRVGIGTYPASRVLAYRSL